MAPASMRRWPPLSQGLAWPQGEDSEAAACWHTTFTLELPSFRLRVRIATTPVGTHSSKTSLHVTSCPRRANWRHRGMAARRADVELWRTVADVDG